MQITDKDIQTFRERAKTELQSNGAVGRLAWDSVVDALCNEVEELRKNAAISNAVDSAWAGVCAACAEGTPPQRCAYYGDPDGCNAPTLGKHPEGNLAERLQEELEKAERRIAELERTLGNASALRKALMRAKRDHWFNMTPELRDEIYDALTSELPSNTVSMRAALQSVNRTMEIEARINCTEKDELGKFGNTQSELCKRCRARNCECWQMTLKREVESALAAPPEPPSNATALREALESCLDFIRRIDRAFNPFMQGLLEDAVAKANAALATPARNCDVGTAEEQAERFRKACKSWSNADDQDYCSYECPIDGNGDCHEKFGQMPFAPEKGDSK